MSTFKEKAPIVVTRYKKSDNTIWSIISYLNRDISYAFENIAHSFPAGNYHAYIYHSNKFKRKVLRVIVPNRTAIAVHPANYYTELQGCIAPITSTSSTGGIKSGDALDKLLSELKGLDLIPFIVTEDYQLS